MYLRLSVPLLILLVGGCGGPSPDEMVKQSIRCWADAADLLASVRNEAGIAAIDAPMMELGRKLADLNGQAAEHNLAPAQVAELTRANRQESTAALRRFEEAAREASTIPGGRDLVVRFRRLAAQK